MREGKAHIPNVIVPPQVTSLVNTGVPASFINSQSTNTEKSAVLRELNKPMPTCKLLYITPEQFVANSSLHSLLASLHGKGLLQRLVIDEVRPDILAFSRLFKLFT